MTKPNAVLTDEQCDEFRRLPVSFNDMVRAIYSAGLAKQAAQVEQALPEFYAQLEYNTPDWDVLVSVYQRRSDDTPLLVHQEKLKGQQAAQAEPPKGWKLVPVKPTEEMHAAAVRTIAQCAGNDDFPPRVWSAMLSAAPTTEAQAEPVAWLDAEAICNLPEVEDAIRTFLADQTGDNATGMAQAILNAARSPEKGHTDHDCAVTVTKLRDIAKEFHASGQLRERIAQVVRPLFDELQIDDKLLSERSRVLKAIPACKAHGSECVPHAIEWIQAQLSRQYTPADKATGPIGTLAKAYELGLEAIRFCAGKPQDERTTRKLNRALDAMCNAMPVLDLIPADAIDVSELNDLKPSYKALMPGAEEDPK